MKYFQIAPEIAGGLGRNTVMDRSVHPPHVTKLHFDFAGWLGDVRLESFPCYIITKEASCKLQSIGLTGVAFEEVEVTVSEQFDDLYSGRTVPDFLWLKVEGQIGTDDFACAPNGRLIVSGWRATLFLESKGLYQTFWAVTGSA